MTGQNTGNTVFVDGTGASYRTNPDGTRTYTSGPLSGQTVYADPQEYLYQQNPDGSRRYLNGPMAGRTAMVDPSGFLYIQNSDGSRTYLTGTLAGRTVTSTGGNNQGLTVNGSGTSSLIYRDDQGTFVMDPDGVKKYLTYVSATSTQQTYRDQSGANYIIFFDSNGNRYTRNVDGTRNYLTGFTSNPLDTFIVNED